ncbi:MAG: pyruvate kinase [Bilophila wadsworthia]
MTSSRISPFDHPEIFAELEQGDRLVLADGTLQFRVVEHREDGLFKLEANNNGIVTSRKGLALPGKSIPLPALTEKDRRTSWTASPSALTPWRSPFCSRPKTSAKPSRSSAATATATSRSSPSSNAATRWIGSDAILKEVDIVMVARGDLGIECPLPELRPSEASSGLQPGGQARHRRHADAAFDGVQPLPTRAETTDVANAVLDGADCVMLSEETAGQLSR